MATDLSAFLADLVSDVVAEIETVKNDPLTALDAALDALAKANVDSKEWQARTAAARGNIQLTTQSTYNAGYEARLREVGSALAKGLVSAQTGSYLKGAITEAAKPFAREYHRLTQAIEAAEQEVATIRSSIEMADLPVGALVSFETKYSQYSYRQIGSIAKVTDQSYIVTLESWHPQHQEADTDAATARIDRVKGIRRLGYTGGRTLQVIGSPARAGAVRAKVAAWRKAQNEAQAYENRVAQAGRDAYGVRERQVQVQQQWDQQYRSAGSEALSEAQRQVLEKYQSEVQALATTFTVRKREVLGQRPEVTAPVGKRGHYFSDFATDEEKEEMSRLRAVSESLKQEVYQS